MIKKIGLGALLLIALVILVIDYTFELGIAFFLGDYLIIFLVVSLVLGGLAGACRYIR